MDKNEFIEHLNSMNKNILKLEILILTLTDELDRQGFVSTKEILEKADKDFEETITHVKSEIEQKLEEIKKDFIYSNILYGKPGEA